MKIIEAYLKLDQVESRISTLKTRLDSSVFMLGGGGQEKARIFKNTVLEIEQCFKEYGELIVNILETLVLTKLEGEASIFESLIKLFIVKKRRDILEDLISLGGDLFKQKNGEKDFIINVFDVSLQSNSATGLIDDLAKLLLSAELKTDLLERVGNVDL